MELKDCFTFSTSNESPIGVGVLERMIITTFRRNFTDRQLALDMKILKNDN
jgi:hypothetical protein